MKKNYFKLMGLTAFAVLSMSMTAFAATKITNVSITCGPDEDASLPGAEGGIVAPAFTSDSEAYSIASASDTSESSTTYKSPRTYEIILSANSGYYFPDEDYVTVTGTGITAVSKKKTDDEYQMTIRVKAYPYYQWKKPEISGDYKGSSIKWNKNGASKVEYIVEWTDKNGEDRSRTGTSTSSSLSLSSYNKKATDSEIKNDKQNSEVTGFAVRAVGNAGDNTRTVASEWEVVGSVDPDGYDFTTYDSWADAGNSGGSASSGSTGGSSSSSAGWVGSGDNWYWKNANGSYSTGWVYDGANWYLCDGNGKMQVGWYYDGTNWFWLNTAHDGTYGRMMTGWQVIDGYQFYLNPVSDGTRGAMYTGWRTVDGVNRYFNEAHDGTYGRLVQ